MEKHEQHREVIGDVEIIVFWSDFDQLWFWLAERWVGVGPERHLESRQAANVDFDYSLAEVRRAAREMSFRRSTKDPLLVVHDADVTDLAAQRGGCR